MTNNVTKDNFEKALATTGEVGYVHSTRFPIVYVEGLPKAFLGEIVFFEGGNMGQVLGLAETLVEILVFSNRHISLGSSVARANHTLGLSLNDDVLGKAIDPLGNSLYKSLPINISGTPYPIDSLAKPLSARSQIREPFLTGVSLVDLMIPLGKGQRQLLIGDRRTGKTAFALQTLLNQSKQGCMCVYACIGKTKADIRKIEGYLKDNNLSEQVVLVASDADAPLGLVHITPYSAMSIAEYYRSKGNDVLIVLDDLTTHANYYREVSLLSQKFPGRNSYPGDMFYTHAKLLERAGKFSSGSITCLALAYTIENDLSGYIQTNLMSMTDGHLFFDKDLFYKGQRPAVNTFLSVTRVGRQTQSTLRWSISRELNSFFALHERTKSFVHFGAELNEGIKATLATGERLLSFLRQSTHAVLDQNLQICLFCLIWSGLWNSKDAAELKVAINKVTAKYAEHKKLQDTLVNLIESSKDLNELLGKFMKKYAQEPGLFE